MKRLRRDVCLQTIGILCDEMSAGIATNGALAKRLGVSTGTVSSLLKRLAADGLVIHIPYQGVRLTSSGLRSSRRLVRRRRLLQQFLQEMLRLPHQVAIDESVELESVASDRLVAAIATMLSQPEWTIMGEPIPSESGELPAFLRLSECVTSEIVSLQWIEGEPHAVSLGGILFQAGVEIAVLINDRETGTVSVRVGGKPLTLGHSTARRLLVRRILTTEPVRDGSATT
ncbi:metal-dependent transcriptional regulator [Planctomyces sp. SH-PL14]|uniref:metal-dependent transcriptional regulator n=1 Tax=Planctomyces sp. SH-PL14 TaxID=1632864 RepID=UPI0012E7F6AA|nr:metal-dependent transcriptional regulator [Planctomyces sp. SH-PL14]